MDNVQTIPFGRRLHGVFNAAHFGPCISVTLMTVLIAIFSGNVRNYVLVALAVLSGQFSVGWCNDYLDRFKDAIAGLTEKPIVSGIVSSDLLKYLSVIALCASLGLSFLYGFWAGIVHGIALISAFAYNFWLKNSALSPLTYAISFGLLPVFIAVGSVDPFVPAWWMITATALLGVGVHFLNVLPDFEADRKTGVKGAPHHFSYKHALLIAAVGIVLSVLSVSVASRNSTVLVGVIGLFLITTFVFMGLYIQGKSQEAYRVSMAMAALATLAVISASSYM